MILYRYLLFLKGFVLNLLINVLWYIYKKLVRCLDFLLLPKIGCMLVKPFRLYFNAALYLYTYIFWFLINFWKFVNYFLFYNDDVEVEASVCWDWLRNATFDAFNLAVFPLEINVPGNGDMLGVEQWLLLKSHWSNNLNSSSAVGPPFGIGSTSETIIIYYMF